ncbi:hypothetical protein GCM10009863_64260 [Streptomyces axinellae]|uniref:Uncharacterized protein n=1 Tax=Streptomyces axinellae TaxID=552788 RepID=A0ABP6DBC0_9ACTN
MHREDDRRLRRGLLELVGQRERLLQLGPDLDAGADLLLEILVALGSVEGFELARQFKAGGRCAGVPDPDRPLTDGAREAFIDIDMADPDIRGKTLHRNEEHGKFLPKDDSGLDPEQE